MGSPTTMNTQRLLAVIGRFAMSSFSGATVRGNFVNFEVLLAWAIAGRDVVITHHPRIRRVLGRE